MSRTFADFDDYWTTAQGSPSLGSALKALPPDTRAALVAGVRTRLAAGADGRVTCRAVANAVSGLVP